MKHFVMLLLLISFCCPLGAYAELPDVVVDDFSVVSGYVVMPLDDKYIVDLDGRDNLHVGDILTLVKPGKKIIHPVTNEVVGSVEEPIGFLQVVRVLSGYSYAKVLTPEVAPENGAQVKRFEQVPVHFVDTTGAGDIIVNQLKTDLPQLQWLESSDKDKALLTFTLSQDAVDVKNTQGELLHKYKLTEDQQLVSASNQIQPTYTTENKKKTRPLQRLANDVIGLFGQTNEERFAEMDAAIIRQKQTDLKGIWIGPNIEGSAAGLVVSDLDGDGKQETAVVLERKIVVSQIIDGEFSQLAEVPIPVRLNVLSIDAVDLDGNGLDELYLSAMSGSDLASFVVEFSNGNYEISIQKVKWFLRAVSLPEHQGQVLVGQQKGGARIPYLGSMFKVLRDGNRLTRGDTLDLPKALNLFSFVPFADEQNGFNYAHLTPGDYLKVFSRTGVDLWESAEYYGGSEISFYPRAEYKDEVLPPARMNPRLIRTSENEILTVQNDSQRLTQNYRKFKNSRIVSLSWNGFAMVEQWRTSSQRGYLADFALADADNDGEEELVMAVKFKHKGLTSPARSSVVIYELE